MHEAHAPTAVIAEDEALLREALVAQLAAAWPGLRIAATCEDGAGALEALAEHQPDVAFLDIRMPGATGLEIAAALETLSPRTRVVFVTAYDQYAVDAFERGAIDYLLKPVTADRLQATVRRLQAPAAPGVDATALAGLARALAARPAEADAGADRLTWLTASAGRETRLVFIEDVLYFRADHKYTCVVTAEGEALLRTPLVELMPRLDPARFRQVHRSTIVNLRAVAGVVREDSGRGVLRLRGRPETLAVSQACMALFKAM